MKKIITLFGFCLMVAALSAQTPALKVDQSGNVGINEANPGFPLTVTVAQATNGIILRTDDGPAPGAKFFQKIETDGYGQLFVRDNLSQDRIFLNSGFGSFFLSKLNVGSATFQSTEFHVEGNASKSAGGNTWDVISDRRLKKNVEDYDGGLDEVLQIRPVTFEYTGKAGTVSGKPTVGIIAQEMQKIAPYMVSEFTSEEIVITDDENGGPSARRVKSSDSFLKYNGNALQYMLVNAIKEQQSQIDELKTQNEELQELVNRLVNEISTGVDATLTLPAGKEGAFIDQNAPNPFKGQTTLDYFIPANVNAAEIAIFGTGGQLIKTVELTDQGKGQLTLTVNDIPSGNYRYSLVLDGKIIDTKTMSIIQ